jgi:hypothetical protein
MKKINISYWICTGILLPALGIGSVLGIMENPDSVKVITSLGYPAYLDPFLGVARLLGLAVIIIPKFPRLKEWAYAGLAFDIIGAMYSIIAADNPLENIVIPAVILLILLGSYMLYHKKLSLAT